MARNKNVSKALPTADDRPTFAGTALISDITANHVETLFRSGTKTLAAFTDLLEVCQAAVLYDKLMISPLSRSHSSLFAGLDFVYAPNVRIAESNPRDDKALAIESPPKDIVIDANDERGLHSNDKYGDMLLAMAFSEMLQDDRLIGNLTNIELLSDTRDPGLAFLKKLPMLMLAVQHRLGLLTYESRGDREMLDAQLSETIDNYLGYSARLLQLQDRWGAGVVTSVLEQPLTSCFGVEDSMSDLVKVDERLRVEKRLADAIMKVPGRETFFKQWKFPPVGMMVVAKAKSLDEIPRRIVEAREKFAPLRAGIVNIERQRIDLRAKIEPFTADGESAARELARLDADLEQAYESFSEEVSKRRKWPERTELVFRSLDYTLTVVKGFGLGIVGKIVEEMGLKRKAIIQRVPGLLKAASTIRSTDALNISSVLGGLLGASGDRLNAHAVLLNIAFDSSTKYLQASPHNPPAVTKLNFTSDGEDPFVTSDREFWIKLILDEGMEKGFFG